MPRYVEIHVHLALVLILCRFPAGCFSISTVFSHAQTVVICSSCSSVLCQPTGGRARLTEGKHCIFPGINFVFNALRQGAHTVGRIEHSLPCTHTTFVYTAACTLDTHSDCLPAIPSIKISPPSETRPNLRMETCVRASRQRRNNSVEGV